MSYNIVWKLGINSFWIQDISLKQLSKYLQKVLTAVSTQQKVAYQNSVIHISLNLPSRIFSTVQKSNHSLWLCLPFLLFHLTHKTRLISLDHLMNHVTFLHRCKFCARIYFFFCMYTMLYLQSSEPGSRVFFLTGLVYTKASILLSVCG